MVMQDTMQSDQKIAWQLKVKSNEKLWKQRKYKTLRFNTAYVFKHPCKNDIS